MKTIVLIISHLFLITAAPVDQLHEIEARSASEEVGRGELQALLTQMRDTLANFNSPTISDPTTRPIGLQVQEPPPPGQTYVLNPLPPVSPPADLRPAPQPPGAQINLYISGLANHERPAAAEPPKQTPLQQLMLANPDPIPAIQTPAQVMTLPASIMPQNAVVMPVNVPPQMYPNMINPLHSSPFLVPQPNPYLQPVNPLPHPQGFGPYPFYPQMYRPNPYVPNVAISPPIIFRERGQTATTQG